MTQKKKDENENNEGGEGWIDASKGRKSKKNPAGKEQVQDSSIERGGPKLPVRSSTMRSSKPQGLRSGPVRNDQQTNEQQPIVNRVSRQQTESSRMPNEVDRKKMVEEVFRLEDEQYHVDLKHLPREYTRSQPYRNVVPPVVVNKKVEQQPEAEPAQIIQHVPSMLTEVHPIMPSSAKMSYADISKKSLRTGLSVAIVPSEMPSNIAFDANDPGLDGEVAYPAPVSRESTPPLVCPQISPSPHVESTVQGGTEKETSSVPATAEILHTSQQTKSDVLEKKTSQAFESDGPKQSVEQVPVEKGSFAVAEDQYMKRVEVDQPQQPFHQAHAIDARGITAHPVVQQQGGVPQFPYSHMVQPNQMGQQWGSLGAPSPGGHMNPYTFPHQMVPSHPQMYNPGSYFPAHFIGTQPNWNTGYSGIPSDVPPGYPKQQYQAVYQPRGYQGYQSAPPHVRLVPSSYYTTSGQAPLSYGGALPPHFGQAFPMGESQPQPSHMPSTTGQTEGSQGAWAPPQESQSAWPGPAWSQQNRS